MEQPDQPPNHMTEISKEDIFEAVENTYNTDLEFIEKLNKRTWWIKVHLKRLLFPPKNKPNPPSHERANRMD